MCIRIYILNKKVDVKKESSYHVKKSLVVVTMYFLTYLLK
jgi:hypothetical protein